MTLACHNLFHIIDAVAVLKGDKVLGLHEVTDRHTLVDETCCSVSIVRSSHNGAAVLLSQLTDGHGNCGALTDNDTVCLHLDGTQLGLVAVAQDNQIMLGNVVLHHVRVCCRNQNFTLIEVIVLIAHNHSALQSLQNVLVLGVRFGQDTAV